MFLCFSCHCDCPFPFHYTEYVSVRQIGYRGSSYGALIEGKSVCQGDAQAYILLARKAGLTAIMATGDMPDGSLHAWNRVWCNNRWYEVDCCYNLICSSFEDYQANVGAVYGGVGIIKSNMGEFYG